MIITFCGHSKFTTKKAYEEKIISYLEKIVGDNVVDMYLGGYGDFDNFAYECCKKFKASHPKTNLVFVTPYYTIEYQRKRLKYQKERYDLIIYPEIENRPLKFAITYRNRYMVDKADYVICYVEHDWGGAYQTYKYAKKKGKNIYNLVSFDK